MAPRVVTPRSAAPVAGVVRLPPAADLADVVAMHWVVAWDRRGAPPMTQEVLPDPCANLAVEPEGTSLYGVVTGRSDHVLADAGLVIGTKFQPGGLSGYVPGPVWDLTDRIVSLPEVWSEGGVALPRRDRRRADGERDHRRGLRVPARAPAAARAGPGAA